MQLYSYKNITDREYSSCGIKIAEKIFSSSDVLKVLKNLKKHVCTAVNFVNKKNAVFGTFWTFS